MLQLKGCPRCGGDLYLDRDIYGSYVACVQCGFHRMPASGAEERPSPVEARAAGSREEGRSVLRRRKARLIGSARTQR